MELALIGSAFLAGLLTFLAPCTLPLLPGYLAFISGVSLDPFQKGGIARGVRKKIFFNGLLYTLGFSTVFIFFGVLIGLGGSAFVHYKYALQQIGGVVIIVFGLYLMGANKFFGFSFLSAQKHLSLGGHFKPGRPLSSFLFGATFAFGWTPCVGPILGSILTLAASTATVGAGAFLLTIFSLGLALPFLLVALGLGSASVFLKRIERFLPTISLVGGAFLVFIGSLILTQHFGAWVGFFYQRLNFINGMGLLEYL